MVTGYRTYYYQKSWPVHLKRASSTNYEGLKFIIIDHCPRITGYYTRRNLALNAKARFPPELKKGRKR